MDIGRNKYEFVLCNICNSNDTITLFEYELGRVVRCKKCGLIYKNPRLTEDEFNKILESAPQQINVDVCSSKEELFSNFLKKIEKIKNKGKILDVGCGSGYFLKLAKDLGWEVYGTEVNPHLIKFAKDEFGINIEKKTLKDFEEEKFDVVTMLEVIDLLRNPKEELKEVRRILKKDGLVFIRVNNGLWHCNLERFRKYFSFLGLYPSVLHLYSFTPRTLKRILQEVGFKDINISVSELTKGDPYKTGGWLGKTFVSLVKSIIYIFSKILYFLSFSKICLSTSIVAYAKKD